MSLRSIAVIFLLVTVACSSDPSNPQTFEENNLLEPDEGLEDMEDMDPPYDGPTWYGQVQAIVFQNCANCHFDGGIAPFDLETYENVYALRELVGRTVMDGSMPPFLPHDSCREYTHRTNLWQDEIDTIVTWVEAGAPAGDPSTAVEVERNRPTSLEPVDVRLTMERPFMPVRTPDNHRCFPVDWPFAEDKFITGFGVEPGNPEMVHHVIAYLARPHQREIVEELVARDEHDGFECFASPTLGGQMAEWLGTWAPGTDGQRFAEGTGIHIPPGSQVLIQVHYNTVAVDPVADQTSVVFSLADQVARQAHWIPWSNPLWLAAQQMHIPAGRASTTHRFMYDPTEFFTNGQAIDILGGGLHMHYLGTSARAWISRGGEEECLVDVPRWDFNWQDGVMFKEPARLNPGERLGLECTWDNSAENQPVINGERATPQDRNWGDDSHDEMCLGIFYISVAQN